jgi:hypothetical protein
MKKNDNFNGPLGAQNKLAARCQALKVKANSSVIIGFPLHHMFIICRWICCSPFFVWLVNKINILCPCMRTVTNSRSNSVFTKTIPEKGVR